MKFILLTAMLFAAQAEARTAFDTLREAFNNAPAPAVVEDFEEGRWESCVFADISAPEITRKTQVRTLQYMTGPGQGPLFPGGNDYRVDVFADYSLDRNIVHFFNSSRIEEDGVNFRQILDGPPWRRMTIFGRVDTDMLLFYVEVSDHYGYHAPMYPRVYGYCWNQPTHSLPGEIPPEEDGGDEIPLPIPAPQ